MTGRSDAGMRHLNPFMTAAVCLCFDGNVKGSRTNPTPFKYASANAYPNCYVKYKGKCSKKQTLYEIFQSLHTARKIRTHDYCGNRRVNRVFIFIGDFFKISDEGFDLCFGHAKQFQVVAHQDDVVAYGFEVDIWKTDILLKTAFYCA